MQKYFILLLLTLNLVACTSTTTVRHAQDYDKLLASYKKAVLLPSEVIMQTSDIGSKRERVDNYEYFLEDILNDEARNVLEKAGYSVQFAAKRFLHDAGISRHFSIARDEYVAHKKEMYRVLDIDKKASVINGRTVASLDKFKEKFPADIYVMIDYEGIIKTSGARAMDFAAAVFIPAMKSAPAETYVMIVTIIDANNGNILWANASRDYRDNFSGMFSPDKKKYERQLINKLLTEALSQLHPKK